MSPAVVDPGAARLVWLVDRAGGFGIWTTDLAGGDVRTYLAGLDEAGVTLRDAAIVGADIVVVRDGPTSALWLIPEAGGRDTPRVLLDRVVEYRILSSEEVLAVRDDGGARELWRVPLDGSRPTRIWVVPLPADGGGELGPFGVAISPDGQTLAAGWVGGPVEVIGPAPASLLDIGAPLVVEDSGRLVAVTGRAGEAYTLTGEILEVLAPPDADPGSLSGTGIVAWGIVGADGTLEAVEVHDLLGGSGRLYPASGRATNVHELTRDHVLLEATAYDPLHRTVAYLDLTDGRFALFEADAPARVAP